MPQHITSDQALTFTDDLGAESIISTVYSDVKGAVTMKNVKKD